MVSSSGHVWPQIATRHRHPQTASRPDNRDRDRHRRPPTANRRPQTANRNRTVNRRVNRKRKREPPTAHRRRELLRSGDYAQAVYCGEPVGVESLRAGSISREVGAERGRASAGLRLWYGTVVALCTPDFAVNGGCTWIRDNPNASALGPLRACARPHRRLAADARSVGRRTAEGSITSRSLRRRLDELRALLSCGHRDTCRSLSAEPRRKQFSARLASLRGGDYRLRAPHTPIEMAVEVGSHRSHACTARPRPFVAYGSRVSTSRSRRARPPHDYVGAASSPLPMLGPRLTSCCSSVKPNRNRHSGKLDIARGAADPINPLRVDSRLIFNVNATATTANAT